jgi:DNA-binding LacI/PurR family transcriptional regulator
MGTTAAQLIIDRVSGKLVPEKIQDIGFEIVVRESA